MKHASLVRSVVVAVGIVVAVGAGVRGQDPLTAAKDLYASASYEDALTILARVRESGALGERGVRDAIEYQALCLLALGRTDEAEQTIAELIAEDPSYIPDEESMAPRIRTMFVAARGRALPAVIRQRYTTAKDLYDKKAFDEAAQQFRLVVTLFADPAVEGSPEMAGLRDLKTVATAFLELTTAALAPPAPAPSPTAVAPSPTPVNANREADAGATAPPPAAASRPAGSSPISRPTGDRRNISPPLQANRPSPTGAPAVPAVGTASGSEPTTAVIYSVGDGDVRPPTTIFQQVPPPFPQFVVSGVNVGVIEVIIDETGAVESALMRTSIHWTYDKRLLEAAKSWRYKPALKDGQSVKYRKVISVNLTM